MTTRDENGNLYDSVSEPKQTGEAAADDAQHTPGFHPGFGAVPQDQPGDPIKRDGAPEAPSTGAPEAQGDSTAENDPAPADRPGPMPGFLTAAEVAAQAEQSSGAGPSAAGVQSAGVPGASATPSFLRTTSDAGAGATTGANEASSAPASVSPPPSMPVAAGSTVFGADLSKSNSARDGLEDTATQQAVVDPEVAERERKAREEADRVKQEQAAAKAREKAERDRRLGTVHSTEPAPAPVVVEKPGIRSNDRFAGAFGLFLMRIITAVVVGAYGYQMLTERPPVIDALESISIPSAGIVTWGLAGLLLVLAVMYIFGFGTRVAGCLTAVLAGLTLAFFRWGAFNPFIEGQAGFSGDIELLLAGLGLMFLFLGGGGWSLDGGIRRSRARRKLEVDD